MLSGTQERWTIAGARAPPSDHGSYRFSALGPRETAAGEPASEVTLSGLAKGNPCLGAEWGSVFVLVATQES